MDDMTKTVRSANKADEWEKLARAATLVSVLLNEPKPGIVEWIQAFDFQQRQASEAAGKIGLPYAGLTGIPSPAERPQVPPSPPPFLAPDWVVTSAGGLRAVLDRVTFVNTVLDWGWQFEFHQVSADLPSTGFRFGWAVYATFERPDTNTGQVGRGRGRDEIVWEGATVSAVVKTCWLLVELIVRHEAMEGFRFNDERIFNPHNSVLDLHRLQTEWHRR